jgi:hypothetical protein
VNPGLTLTGIVMTMYDPRTKLSEQVVQEVRRYFGDRVYDTIIPRTVRLSEAPGFGQPITVYDPKSRGAQRYRDLAKEVADKPRPAEPLPMMDDLPMVVVPPPDAADAADAPETPAAAARAPRPLVRGEDAERDDEASSELDDPEDGAADLAGTEALAEVEALPPSRSVPRPADVQPAAEVEPPAPAADPLEPADDVVDPNGHPSVEVIAPIADAVAADPRAASGTPRPDVEPAPPNGSAARPDVEGSDAPVEPEVDGWIDADVSEHASTGGPTVAAPRLEGGRVILVDEQPAAEEPRPMPEPDDNGEASGKRRRRLFRRGGDR